MKLTARGASSPAKPALHIPDPLSITRAATSSDSAQNGTEHQQKLHFLCRSRSGQCSAVLTFHFSERKWEKSVRKKENKADFTIYLPSSPNFYSPSPLSAALETHSAAQLIATPLDSIFTLMQLFYSSIPISAPPCRSHSAQRNAPRSDREIK